jgi:hypothetical protein
MLSLENFIPLFDTLAGALIGSVITYFLTKKKDQEMLKKAEKLDKSRKKKEWKDLVIRDMKRFRNTLEGSSYDDKSELSEESNTHASEIDKHISQAPSNISAEELQALESYKKEVEDEKFGGAFVTVIGTANESPWEAMKRKQKNKNRKEKRQKEFKETKNRVKSKIEELVNELEK